MVIIPSRLEIFCSQNTKDVKNDIKPSNKLLYSSSKVQYFAAKNSYNYTFFPKLKHSLVKIIKLGFYV